MRDPIVKWFGLGALACFVAAAVIMCSGCDNAPVTPPDLIVRPDLNFERPLVTIIDCDMSPFPKLLVDGGYCVQCGSPNRVCCEGAFVCGLMTKCNDAGPWRWCEP